MEYVYALKKVKRKGWQIRGIEGESVAEHSFSAALLAAVFGRQDLVLPLLLHDLPEAVIGDHLPGESDKSLEAEIYRRIVPEQLQMDADYKDFDILDRIVQAYFYELEGYRLDEFWSELPKDPALREFVQWLREKRPWKS